MFPSNKKQKNKSKDDVIEVFIMTHSFPAAPSGDLSANPAAASVDTGTAQGDAKKKSFLKTVFNKAADIAGRAAVTQGLRLGALSVVAGAGASAVVSIGVAAAAAGAGAALYSYGKDTYMAWRSASALDDDSFRWMDTGRLKKARTALLFGVAGGAFGAWLAGTDTFQHGLEFAKTYGGKMIESVLNFFGGTFSSAPAAASLPAPAVDVATPVVDAETINARVAAAHEAVAAPAADIAAPAEDDIIARIDAAHGLLDAERAGLEIVPAEAAAPATVLNRLWGAAMTSDQAKGAFMAQMMKADPDDLSSVTPQFLKDRAHDVLRLTDLPWQDRLSLARELAEEAQARGNRQAAGFLRDLAKLEDGSWKPRGLNITGTEDIQAAKPAVIEKPAVVAKEIVTPKAAPALEKIIVPEQAPVKTVILDTDSATGTVTERVVDGIAGPGLTIEAVEQPVVQQTVQQTPKTAFERAAVCTVTMAGDHSAAETFCEVSKTTMKAGDYVTFVAAHNVTINVSTTLLDGSVDVPTQSFLHEKVIGDGVARLNGNLQGIKVPGR
jgi:hypothetical protein